MEALLKGGADIEAVDDRGRTALCIAAKYGALDCINVLNEYGANHFHRDDHGLTALEIAEQSVRPGSRRAAQAHAAGTSSARLIAAMLLCRQPDRGCKSTGKLPEKLSMMQCQSDLSWTSCSALLGEQTWLSSALSAVSVGDVLSLCLRRAQRQRLREKRDEKMRSQSHAASGGALSEAELAVARRSAAVAAEELLRQEEEEAARCRVAPRRQGSQEEGCAPDGLNG